MQAARSRARSRAGRAARLQDLAHEREAVGVNAGGGQPQHHVPRLDALAVDQTALVHGSHRKAGEVVLAVLVHPRHLCRLRARGVSLLLAATQKLQHGPTTSTAREKTPEDSPLWSYLVPLLCLYTAIWP